MSDVRASYDLWGFVLVLIEIGGKTRSAGGAWNTGNREVAPEVPAWVARAGRALVNHKENFPLFLTAVLVVHLAGRADAISAAASVVYVVARAAHGLLYIAGVPVARTAVWLAGVGATFIVFSQLW